MHQQIHGFRAMTITRLIARPGLLMQCLFTFQELRAQRAFVRLQRALNPGTNSEKSLERSKGSNCVVRTILGEK